MPSHFHILFRLELFKVRFLSLFSLGTTLALLSLSLLLLGPRELLL